MMKMSYNKLKIISRHTFQGLWNLARLHLDHNHLEFIHPDAFQGLTSLRLLQLEGNRLQQLHPATFATFSVLGYFPMSTLKHLYLSENGLTTLSQKMLATMPQLENLFLHENPWTCDCRMKWFKEWSSNAPGQHLVLCMLYCSEHQSLTMSSSYCLCASFVCSHHVHVGFFWVVYLALQKHARRLTANVKLHLRLKFEYANGDMLRVHRMGSRYIATLIRTMQLLKRELRKGIKKLWI